VKHVSLVILLLVIFALSISVAAAQDSLAYGDIVTGLMKEGEFEFEYTFEGTEDDVIVIEMRRTNTDDDMTRPEIFLLDSTGDTVATTQDGPFSYGKNALAVRLPATDTYTILATRVDGASGDSTGEFELELIQPEILELGADVVEGQIDNEAGNQYYLLPSVGLVTLTYVPGDATYVPIVAINQASDGTLRPMGQIAGLFVEAATLTIDADDDELYIVTISANESDYFFQEIEAEYEISASGE
jgi:hypothetical protein